MTQFIFILVMFFALSTAQVTAGEIASKLANSYIQKAQEYLKSGNETKAAHWLHKAAVFENPFAQYKYAKALYDGVGIDRNRESAFYWFEKVATNPLSNKFEIIDSKFMMGTVLYGHKNREAFEILMPLAKNGYGPAQTYISHMYSLGRYVKKNETESVKWLQKSAMNGHVKAFLLLASSYKHGRGIPQNFKYSYIWYSIASSSGYKSPNPDTDIVKERDLMFEKLTDNEKMEAQRLAKEIHAQINYSGEIATHYSKIN